MIEWIDYQAQRFPTEEQQLENYNRNHNSEYLLVIAESKRGKNVLSTVPANLFYDNHEGDYYWTVVGTDNTVAIPIKWALMPSPEGSWISTEDKVPVAGVSVLATDGEHMTMVQRLSETTFKQLVKYWMPLPTLPTRRISNT